jgi:preprotein translocase subunit SecF
VELFHQVDVDWLGKKWYFLAFSLVFSVAGVFSLLFWHHLNLGVDFKGGTLVYVQFADRPNIDEIRRAMDRAGIHDATIQNFGSGSNQVIISLAQRETRESALDAGRQTIVDALHANYGPAGGAAEAPGGKLDLDNASQEALTRLLTETDPEHLAAGGTASARYGAQAAAILNRRNQALGGLFTGMDQLNGVADPPVAGQLRQDGYLSGFHVFNVEVIGPQVGAELRKQALLATLYSLAGMLVYLWFRFELIYGVAAVVAVFHDTLITIGAFSLSNREITLTVIAAILTLIGYSMNDTIVVFDRIRENLKTSRRESLPSVVNRSINQTLSRTVLTSGLTFLTVLSLYVFGGEVLRGFSFALVVGILIGTYSSIAVAAPMLVAYQEWRARHGKRATLPAGKRARA